MKLIALTNSLQEATLNGFDFIHSFEMNSIHLFHLIACCQGCRNLFYPDMEVSVCWDVHICMFFVAFHQLEIHSINTWVHVISFNSLGYLSYPLTDRNRKAAKVTA